MQHRIPTFSTSLRTLLALTSVCIAGAVTGTLKAGEFEDNAYRVVSPQVVATSDIETTLILSNPLVGDTCEVRVSYHLGGGTKSGFPILTNGEDLGHDFTIHLEGATFFGNAEFTPLKVTTNGDATKTSAFAPKRTLVTGYRSALQLLYLGRKNERA